MRIQKILLLFSFLSLLVPAPAAAALTQRDWLVNLAEVLGWSFGLPDEPTDADYLLLASGNRRFRFEAETMVAPDVPVVVRNFQTFGPFSGPGWIGGTAAPAPMTLQLLLPHGGRYTVSAALRLPGHQIGVGPARFVADGEHRFSRVDIGTLDLPPGPVEVDITLPPDGGIDYLEFSSPDQPAVEPPGGWDLDAPLSVEVMAATAVQALQLHSLLPPAGDPLVLEAEEISENGEVGPSRECHLGVPSGECWLRAGPAPAEVSLAFDLPAAGLYDLRLRAAGGDIRVEVNDHLSAQAVFPGYLDLRDLGPFRLPRGRTTLRIQLPPRGGVDAVSLHPKRSDGRAYRRLAGLAGLENPPAAAQVESLLALLAALGDPRSR